MKGLELPQRPPSAMRRPSTTATRFRRYFGLPLIAAALVAVIAGCATPSDYAFEVRGPNGERFGVGDPAEDRYPYDWTTFVNVTGQPEPVPEEWVSTPEGKFAHAIVVPDPVPKDSGYRWTMSATDYFLHLCEKEAGEFVYRKVEGVEGVLFMRPLFQPSDQMLMDRYKLEAPGLLSGYQLWGRRFSLRAAPFVKPGNERYHFYEEPVVREWFKPDLGGYLRGSERDSRAIEVQKVESVPTPAAKYGVTWRGLIRHKARQHSIGAEEILILDLKTGEVIGLLRRFFLTGRTGRTPQGVWWLNAARCPQFVKVDPVAGTEHLEHFFANVLLPADRTSTRGAQ